MKLPTTNQLSQLLNVFSKKEKHLFFVLFFLLAFSISFFVSSFYLNNTEVVPAQAGAYTEGLIGSPRWLNPLFSPANDVDKDIVELLFAGLMKYNAEGEIVPDLAKNYEISEDGKTYEFFLKPELFWSDNKPLTADDIVFTIQAIQNPEIRSPLRPNWLGVEIEKISDATVRFKLKNPSVPFLENCCLKPIPKHIWENVPSQNFALSQYNLKPVGSGPFRLQETSSDKDGKIKSLILTRNPYYSGEKANLKKISFLFYENEQEQISAFKNKEIDGCLLNSWQEFRTANVYSFSLPRYFALFFNPEQSEILDEKSIRTALNYGTDKKEILANVFQDQGKIIDSPLDAQCQNKIEFDQNKAKELLEEQGFLKNEQGFREKNIKPKSSFVFKANLQIGSRSQEVRELQKCLGVEETGYFGPKTKSAVISFQEKYKDEILSPYGLKSGTGQVRKSTRAKLNEVCWPIKEEIIPLKFSLATVNQPKLIEVANILKEQWAEIGVDLEIKLFDLAVLEKEVIKPRQYDILLFGEILGLIPDPFPFWHSSQKKDPGLNLSLYENIDCDKILEQIREEFDENERTEKLQEFQEYLCDDQPALFLYNPDELYLVSKKIKGITQGLIAQPSNRFSDIGNWYIKTKRVIIW